MRRFLTTTVAMLCLLGATQSSARKSKAAKSKAPVADTLPENFFAPGSSYSGKSTFYRNRGSGACALPSGDTFTAAVSKHQFARSALCGSCVEATGPSGSVIARVTDRCPGCPSGGLDLSREAFAKVAPLSMGRALVSWKFTACPGDTQMSLHRKGKSARGQISLQVRNHAVPLRGVEVQTDTGWLALVRLPHNRFVGRNLPDAPWSLRLTDVWNRSTVDTGIVVAPDSVTRLDARFASIPLAPDTLLSSRAPSGQSATIDQ
ncbi:MAG: hypothetical protein RL318_124 [Fibrobacterota bacterium]|jgi:expansin (peptidoglycan-binding protein)